MISVHQALKEPELAEVFRIRFRVFVDEQMVLPDEEYDEFETKAHHYLAQFNGLPVGASRWVEKNTGVKLERFAVLPNFRGLGVGRALASYMMNDIACIYKTLPTVFLHAQLHAVPFYEKIGFKADDLVFEEAGILHKKMFWLNE